MSDTGGRVPPDLRVSSRAGRLLLLATIAGSGIAFLDTSVVNVALPKIGADLGGGFATVQWVVDGYLLTLGALVLVGGALGDLLGKRRVFVAGLLLFGSASVACGLAPTAWALIGARLVQGVGAALLVPGSLAILSEVFSGAERGKAIGAWSGLAGVFTALGPFVGGLLVDSGPSGWRWVFLVNVPLIAGAVWLAMVGVPDLPGTRTSAPLAGQVDVLGGLLTVIGLGLVVGPLIEYARIGAGPAIALLVLGVVVLAGFVQVERHRSRTLHPPPMLPLTLFGFRGFNVANIVTFVVYGALGAGMLLVTVVLQVGLGYSALQAGAAGLPITVLLAALSSRVGGLVPKVGARPLLTGGCAGMAVGLVLLARIGPESGYLTGVLPAICVFGLGLSLVVAPVTTTALGDVAGRQAGAASGVNNAVARIGSLVAIALLPLLGGLSGGGVAGTTAFFDAYSSTQLWGAGLCAAAAAISWFGFTADTARSPRAPSAGTVP
ncbi:MAG TPA: MFS transporter [Candidatus Nanopelagicales bacterium]|nr:MFS transporter [Candidatus Nanopelagicales bacterium]